MHPSSAPSTVIQRHYSLGDARLYLATAAMVVGNLALPYAVHRVPDAGPMLMPILFFTLIAGWRYGLKAAVLTAALSPLVNHLLTGMPPALALRGLVLQSLALGVLAALAGLRGLRPNLANLALVVAIHQAMVLAPVLIDTGAAAALAGLRLHAPGILLQVLGGWAMLQMMVRSQPDPTAEI